MKFLFVHQNFPGQFLHLVRHLVKSKKHDVVFITEPNPNQIPGVHKVPYRKPRAATAETHAHVRDLDEASRRAEVVAQTAANLKALDYTPDIIIGHHGWGEMLHLCDVWPKTPLLGYMEFYYRIEGADVGFDPEFPTPASDFARIRAKNATNLLALSLGATGQTPTEWQLSTYPKWAHDQIELLREGVDLDKCKPDAAVRRQKLVIGDTSIGPREKLVTYVSRDLEPYRGFHVMMRAIPHLLRERKDVRVVMVGGNGVSYGNAPKDKKSWKDVMLAELGDQIDPKRVIFPGRMDYDLYVRMLQRSDAHVYLTYPFVASWSLREAMATGCAVIGSDTQPVQEFVEDGNTGRLVSFFDPKNLADRVLELIEDTAQARRLRANARRYAEQHLSMTDYLAGYDALIDKLVNGAR